MAFPSIASTASTGPTADATSHSVTLPSGISSGDLLIALVSVDNRKTASITGWTKLYSELTPLDTGELFYRFADGSEGASMTVNVDGGTESISSIVLRITGADNGTAPEASMYAIATDANPDPSSLSPSWGAEDTLWLATAHWQVSADISANPAGYSAGGWISGGGTIQETCVGYASRQLNASSEDPGVFTLSTGRAWVAFTVAIRPAASAVKGGIVIAQQLEMLGGGLL